MTNELISAIRSMQKQLGLVPSTRKEIEKAGDIQDIHDKLLAQFQTAKVDQAEAVLAAAAPKQTAEDKEIAAMLIRLNEYRMQIQKKPLKVWKGTRDELAASITEAKRIHKEGVKSTPTKPAAPAKKVIASPMTEAKKSLAAIVAKEMGMHPKIFRAKLRAAFGGKWKSMPIKELRAFAKK